MRIFVNTSGQRLDLSVRHDDTTQKEVIFDELIIDGAIYFTAKG